MVSVVDSNQFKMGIVVIILNRDCVYVKEPCLIQVCTVMDLKKCTTQTVLRANAHPSLEIWVSSIVMSKNDILLNSINQFYNDDKNKTTLLNILDKTSGISLRNLEWFITNYAKKNQTSYTTSNGKLFTVHCAYKSSLDGYSKKLFDPFCRSQKFGYKIPGTSHEIQTTIAQLNFIKWCIKNKIIDYISDNKDILFNKQVT